MLKKFFATAAVTAASASVLLMASPAQADDDWETSGNGSVLGGNQLGVDLNVPINVCGNSIAIIGIAGAYCEDSGAVVVDD